MGQRPPGGPGATRVRRDRGRCTGRPLGTTPSTRARSRCHPLRGRQDAPNGRSGSPTTPSPDKNGESVDLVIVLRARERVLFAHAVRRYSPERISLSFVGSSPWTWSGDAGGRADRARAGDAGRRRGGHALPRSHRSRPCRRDRRRRRAARGSRSAARAGPRGRPPFARPPARDAERQHPPRRRYEPVGGGVAPRHPWRGDRLLSLAGQREELALAAARVGPKPDETTEERAQALAVYAPRGGAGGTLVATHLAAALAKR